MSVQYGRQIPQEIISLRLNGPESVCTLRSDHLIRSPSSYQTRSKPNSLHLCRLTLTHIFHNNVRLGARKTSRADQLWCQSTLHNERQRCPWELTDPESRPVLTNSPTVQLHVHSGHAFCIFSAFWRSTHWKCPTLKCITLPSTPPP